MPRIAKTTLQLPLTVGGLALPCFCQYYWVTVLVTVRWLFEQPRSNPAVNLEAAILGSYSALSNLVFRGTKAHINTTVPMTTTIRVWVQMSTFVGSPHDIYPHTPLWGNPRLPHLRSISDPTVWARHSIIKLQHVIPESALLSYDSLKSTYHLPLWMFFQYLQLRHVVQSQFPEIPVIKSHSVESFLISSYADRILSSLYL